MGIQINGQTDTISAFDNNFSLAGNVSIGGTLTYEDVTSVDAVGLSTFQAGIHLDDSIIHLGDTNTKIRFPAADTITAETAGTERLRIASDGNITLGYAGNSLYFQNGFNNRASRIQNGGGSGSADLKFYTNNAGTEAERLSITSTGKCEVYKGTSTTGKTSGSEAFTVGNGAGNKRFSVYPDGTTVIGGQGIIGNYNILLQNDGHSYFGSRMKIGTTTEGEANADDLTIATSAHTGMTIRSGTANRGNIYFSDGTSGDAEYRGYITYDHDGDRFKFGTANADRLVINSAGHVRVNTGDFRVGDDTDSNAGSQTISVGSVSSGSGGIGIFANPTNGNSWVQFGDGTSGSDQYRGYMNYQHADDSLRFGTAASEKLRITSGGDVCVGGHSSNYANSRLEVRGTNAGGDVAIRVTNNSTTSGTQAGIIFTTTTADYTTAGIGFERGTSEGLKFYVGQSAGGGGFTNATERLRITSAGIIQCGTSATLKAEINNAVGGHQFISQCSDNNNGFEVWQQHGTTSSRNTFAVYANTGSSNAKNTQFAVRGDGVVSSPQQPLFQATGFPSHRYMNVWQNVALSGWNYVTQNGSHFNNSNGRFTAPVAGKYFFIYTAMYHNPNSNDFAALIKKNNNTVTLSNNISGGGSSEGHQWNDCTIQAVVDMAANDFVTFTTVGSNSSTCYLYGSSGSTYNSASGFLIG